MFARLIEPDRSQSDKLKDIRHLESVNGDDGPGKPE
jgi:hypothetical protein